MLIHFSIGCSRDEYGETYTYTEDEQEVTERTTYSYDAWGNTITETTETVVNDVVTDSVSNEYQYDALNRLVDESDGETVTQYKYDATGNVIWQKEGDEVTRTLYDNHSRVIQEIAPEDYDATKDGLASNTDSYSDADAGQRYVYDSTTGLTDE